MKKKHIILIVIAAVLLAAVVLLMLLLIGKEETLQLSSEDLMADVRGEPVEAAEKLDVYGPAVADFSLRLFQSAMEPGENSLISPLSVLSTLAITANGADGETLGQMEDVMGLCEEDLNLFLYSFMELAEEREINRIHLANAIWFREDDSLTVEPEFLKTIATYYDAGIYKATFDDTTRKDINSWVSDRTQGMIPEILTEIPEEAMLYVVNALGFEGKWQNIYYDLQVHKRTFTTESGEEQTMELMYSDESYYLSDEKATGFMKPYQGGKYAFVALLPNEGVSVEEYVMGLTGEHLYEMLSAPEETFLHAGLPKFEMDCDYELSDVLLSMGMTDAFDMEWADLTRMGSSEKGNLYLSRVLHKTYISVTEEGTRAAAASVEELPAGEPPNPKEVYLDRPFLYMIIDCETCTPLFMGTVMTME